MPTPNPQIEEQLQVAKEKLAQLRAEKLRLFPPNPHPFIQTDAFPKNATSTQVRHRNALVKQIEELEQQIDDLQDRLYNQSSPAT